MGDDWHCWGCDVVSEELLVVVSRNVIVTNSITNPRIVIMVFLHTPTSLYSH